MIEDLVPRTCGKVYRHIERDSSYLEVYIAARKPYLAHLLEQ